MKETSTTDAESLSKTAKGGTARPLTASVSHQGFTRDFKHSGMGYSKRRGMVVVDNNAISQINIKAATTKEQKRQLSRHINTAST
jgi:hypothetical protein